MTTAIERAHAALESAERALEPSTRRETSHEWAARAPEDPEAIKRWLREAPDDPSPPVERSPAPAAIAPNLAEIAALKAKVAALETKIADMDRPKERRRRKAGRSYLVADYGGNDE